MLTRDPVVQIHPSRFCNYTCLHCYSSSSPSVREDLSVAHVLATTRQLAGQGYRRASLSGGEPVLFSGFERLTQGLTEQGYAVSVITNGTHAWRLAQAMDAGNVSSASVSFDGLAPLHDQIRNKPGAFDRAIAAVQTLGKAGADVGAVIAVTTRSLPQLPQLVARLIAEGVRLVQFHPLALVGRARTQTAALGPALPQEALVRLLLLTAYFQNRHKSVRFQCDALVSGHVPVPGGDLRGHAISPIVIRDDGVIVPYAYDVAPAFALGRVGASPIVHQIDNALGAVLDAALSAAAAQHATTVYREIVAASHSAAMPGATGSCALKTGTRWRRSAQARNSSSGA